MASRLLVVTAVATAVLAYSNTAPVVAWSSLRYVSIWLFRAKRLTVHLAHLPSTHYPPNWTAHSTPFLSWEAFLTQKISVTMMLLSSSSNPVYATVSRSLAGISNQFQQLHASDLRTLSPTAHIARCLSSSPSARQYPYLPTHPELDLTSIAGRVSSKCGSRLLEYSPGHADVTLKQDAKHVVYLGMPHLEESGRARKEAISNHGWSSPLSTVRIYYSFIGLYL
jgi:hypothetical protein